jgi:hypothetical protein
MRIIVSPTPVFIVREFTGALLRVCSNDSAIDRVVISNLDSLPYLAANSLIWHAKSIQPFEPRSVFSARIEF